MFRAKDLMTRNALTVRPDTPIYEALRKLADNGITGLPVVSDEGMLLGILSEKDVLRLLYEEHAKDKSVSDYMTPEVVSFDENDTLVDICECLIQNDFRRVPILSEGKLTGIISRTDMIRYILKLRKADA